MATECTVPLPSSLPGLLPFVEVGPDDSETQTLQQQQSLQGLASTLFATGATGKYSPFDMLMFPS